MKKTLHRGGFETLNVYTNLAGGFLGYAYLPGLPDSHLWQDGIVLNWESMPERRRRSRGCTTSASRSCTRPATGSTSSTPSTAAATPRATSSTTRRRCGCRRGAARRARTRAASRARPDPQLHGLLGRPLLQPVHRGAGRPHAGRLAVPPGRLSTIAGGSVRLPPATLTIPGARSSGDRAFASGAKGRTFESCRAHALPFACPWHLRKQMPRRATPVFRRMPWHLRKQMPRRANP